jgi:hypothetical protein
MSKRAFLAVVMLAACGSDGEDSSPTDQQRGIEVAEKCSARSLQDCAANSECTTLLAMAVDAERQCLESEVPVVCTKKNLGCDTALSIVEVAGKRYRMNGSCDTPGVDVVEASFTPGTPEIKQLAWSKCGTEDAAPACAVGTTLFSPGCGAPQLPTKGCYATCSVTGDTTSCAAGYTCQETWVDPCVPKPGETSTCDACGSLTRLCLPMPAGS